MHTAAFIVAAIAFGINNMLLFQRCSEAVRPRLSHGLAVALATTAIQTLLFIIGMYVGDLLHFEMPDTHESLSQSNALVMLGLTVFVTLRQLMPYLRREPRLPLFDIGTWKPVGAMGVATGINLLLVGIGCGFVTPPTTSLHKALWPMLVALFIFAYWGVMLGRQKVSIRPRRWAIVAAILLLGVAIGTMVDA